MPKGLQPEKVLPKMPLPQKQDPFLPYKERIEELENQIAVKEEEDMLKDPVSYKREVLTVLNRIANNLENNQAGEAESDETLLDENGYGPEEKPEPEPVKSKDF